MCITCSYLHFREHKMFGWFSGRKFAYFLLDHGIEKIFSSFRRFCVWIMNNIYVVLMVWRRTHLRCLKQYVYSSLDIENVDVWSQIWSSWSFSGIEFLNFGGSELSNYILIMKSITFLLLSRRLHLDSAFHGSHPSKIHEHVWPQHQYLRNFDFKIILAGGF